MKIVGIGAIIGLGVLGGVAIMAVGFWFYLVSIVEQPANEETVKSLPS